MQEIIEFDRIKSINIEEEMKTSYIDYAMSVIIGRALPDVRDGLKPVHRRIIYAMSQLGLTPDKTFRKSARIVGDVLGKYHPHGDSSVYDAMVRMAQEWSIRYLIVNGQGNFGSVDGDSAAAMRYTEAKMGKIAAELLRDINKETVDFVPNFDESETEPSVLPSKYPNLLVNGSSGIAVGMATNIPPHNLGEIIDGTIAFIDDPEITIDELMKHVKGPDFPTAGIVLGKSGIKSAYRTGRGRIKVRGKVDVVTTKKGKKQIVITEIPYMVNKSKLVEKIAELVKEKKIEGISDLRDESDLKKGMSIIIDLKRDANETIILNQLYKHTQLQETFGVIMLALVNNEPKVLNLKEILFHYIEHQKEIITRRTIFDLKKAEARAHILEGLKIALDHIDEVIKLIRAAADGKVAKEQLVLRFSLSEIQAQAILDMRLQRLTGLEREKIEEEYKELMITIAKLKAILGDGQLVLNIIKEELIEIKEKYGDKRRTNFDIDVEDFEIEDLIEEEEVVITMTHIGYVKRITADNYRSQKRGGKGITALSTRENDFVEHLFTTTTHHYLMFFTNLGKVYRLKAFEIPEGGRTARGTAIVNLLPLEAGEQIATMIPVKEFTADKCLIMATKQGIIKKTDLTEYDTSRKNGIIAINLREGDELINVRLVVQDEEIVMGTQCGYAIRFSSEEVRPISRTSIGVRGIDLRADDVVVGMDIVKKELFVLCVSENGYGKLSASDLYRPQKRGGKGVQTYKVTKKTGQLVGFCVISRDGEIMMINNQGVVIKLGGNDITAVGRNTQGVRLMKLKPEESIATISKVYKEDPVDDLDDDDGENQMTLVDTTEKQ
ncbi:DNA gyrase subunit A [Acetobacterium carbinolicum]|jgi:DNA gyrase subunit A|uniref:DNA gyrase subunit A n=1 Tax=Acetobacterium TaxID=33951 RepID=UPI000DBEB320|nr:MULTISPECIES: DNA gyrase subunit A [unclassified Acetobacterium]AWW27338.1 DNA gyrase subunit A [Acetobacterium sp. KB-1]MDZ5725472.1 DNA gyrase subunit A [Acetobacterium sp. K1/6]